MSIPEHRSKIVKAIKYVNKVIPEKSWKQKIEDIKEDGIDIFVKGDNWEGKFDFPRDYCEEVYLKRADGISTTAVKNYTKKMYIQQNRRREEILYDKLFF